MIQKRKKTGVKAGKTLLVTMIAVLVSSVMMAQNQQKTFMEAFMKLRQPQEGEEIVFEKLGRKEIRELLIEPLPEGLTEEEKNEYLSLQAFFKNVKQVSFVIDMEEEEDMLTPVQLDGLLRSYDELISFQEEDMRLLCSGVFKKNKMKELIVLIHDAEDDGLIFANVLFKKPCVLSDYFKNPEDVRQIFSINSPSEEDDHAFIKIKFNNNFTLPTTIPGYDNSVPYKYAVVQVEGKYGVCRIPEPSRGPYIVSPTYDIEPVIYGSYPGNTYIVVLSGNDCYLHDKFGFTVAWGIEMTPVYVIGNDQEVAAFIIRDDWGYSLYECPEVYDLKPEGSLKTNDYALRPLTERRIKNCQSITPTDDGQFECVKEDGSIEHIPIRTQYLGFRQTERLSEL